MKASLFDKINRPWWGLLLLFVCASVYPVDDVPKTLKPHAEFLESYCERCHNDWDYEGDWSLFDVAVTDINHGKNLARWEKILRSIRLGEMPPAKRKKQPSSTARDEFVNWLESSLDNYSAANPNPGRTTLRRLNRSEYRNAVRDLLNLDVDISDELPIDDSGYGFDNIADVLTVSPTLMDRYIAVAGKISRLAVGEGPQHAVGTTYVVPKDGSIMNQGIPSFNYRMDNNLPIDSRGGGAFDYYAPHDGVYEISGYLNANTNNEVDRLEENRYRFKVPLTAGPHSVGMAFRKKLALDESVQTLKNTTDIVVMPSEAPEMLTLDFIVDGARVGHTEVPSYHMSPRFSQKNYLRDVVQIDVEGPLEIGRPGTTPSQEKIFICQAVEGNADTNSECARTILSTLARQAYRRPVSEVDIDPLMGIFNLAYEENTFSNGIAAAIQALLVSPSFLFLHESDPQNAEPGYVHQISDMEFASRLALFLWSSLPDEELISLATERELRKPDVLQKQVTRMLADERAESLTKNFAGQWLYLRNLEHQRPDVFLFPNFDVPLRKAMKTESEMFFSHIVRENRSLFDFIQANYTFLNQRLAEHYGIDNIKGTMFRKVNLESETNRGGLLGQASILTVTSYGNHTSPVRRGKWILENLLAAPPPPPPPDVPALKTQASGKDLNAREQMALHRADPACASCHVKMDPLGLSLEHYDAVGAFRVLDAGRAVDASATMPDGTHFTGLPGLQKILLSQKTEFAHAFTEKLMIYALGRGLEAHDYPKIRKVVRNAAEQNYAIQNIILGIIKSEPFNYRSTSAL